MVSLLKQQLFFVHLCFKVKILWEGLKNLAHLPHFIWHYLVASNYNICGRLVTFLCPSQNVRTYNRNFFNNLPFFTVNVLLVIFFSIPELPTKNWQALEKNSCFGNVALYLRIFSFPLKFRFFSLIFKFLKCQLVDLLNNVYLCFLIYLWVSTDQEFSKFLVQII